MYPSKVLIAGEYTVLLNKEALAVPFDFFSGGWRAGVRSKYTFDWQAWLSHIADLESDDIAVNMQRITLDYEEHIRFVSNVPQGIGLGSSGSLVAAFFDRYVHPRPEIMDDRASVQHILAAMEAFFHGVSSGVDPLIAYYQMAYWYLNGDVFMEERPVPDSLQLHVILTNTTRQSQPYIRAFQQRMKTEDGYQSQLEKYMLPAVHDIIHGWHKGEVSSIELAFDQLSHLQWELFQPMIHDDIKKLWRRSLKDDTYAVKLCGAGGGGAYLAIGALPDNIKLKTIRIK